MEIKAIKDVFAKYGIDLDDNQVILFQRYIKILQQENKKYNLTRIIEQAAIIEEHFYDSLYGLGSEPYGEKLLDLGSGAGFPGIPIKILLPWIKLFLVEAAGKKVLFLKKVVRDLKLQEVTLWQQRAEYLARGEMREKFPWVVARAVAPLAVILELALPLVGVGGEFWSWQGPKGLQDLGRARDILLRCGGKLVDVKSYRLPDCGKDRMIFIIKKVNKAEEKFPRRDGIPQKRPWYNKISEQGAGKIITMSNNYNKYKN